MERLQPENLVAHLKPQQLQGDGLSVLTKKSQLSKGTQTDLARTTQASQNQKSVEYTKRHGYITFHEETEASI